MSTITSQNLHPEHPVVSSGEWLAARKKLLKKEKELDRLRDELSSERRSLPWEKVEKNHVFHGPDGKVALGDLFAGRSQLIIYHFMFGPGWEEGCPSCSFVSDHFDGTLPHLAARDVSLVAVSRAPLAKLEAFQKRMGWKFPWVSSADTSFNFDFHVSFPEEKMAEGGVYYNYQIQEFPNPEAPGLSVFTKGPDGTILHTYSSFGRGVEALMGTYRMLDLVPKGRNEDGLNFPMEWVRYHDRYATDTFADAEKPYWPQTTSASACGCGSSGHP